MSITNCGKRILRIFVHRGYDLAFMSSFSLSPHTYEILVNTLSYLWESLSMKKIHKDRLQEV